MQDSERAISLRVGAASHVGKVRQENQDRISRFRSPLGEIFVVADGMGGHEGGGLAAEMTIEGLERHLGSAPPDADPTKVLQEAATRINQEIYARANSGAPETRKMGSTLVLALLQGSRVMLAHAGDSRAYLWDRDRLRLMTRDHTVVQRMVDHNMLTEEEAHDHPDANVITRAFGQKPEMELEISAPFELRPGQRLLLCSDGLSGYVTDEAIERELAANEDPQVVTERLIEKALTAGGEDNISIQSLFALDRYQTVRTPARPQPIRRWKRHPSTLYWILLAGLALLALLIGMVLGYRFDSLRQRLPWNRDSPATEEPKPEPVPQSKPETSPPPPREISESTLAPAPPPPAATGRLEETDTATPEEEDESRPLFRITIGDGFSAQFPQIRDRLRKHFPRGNFMSTPMNEEEMAGLKNGVVYFYPESDPRLRAKAQKVAEELGLSLEPLPENHRRWSGPGGSILILPEKQSQTGPDASNKEQQ